MSTPTPSDVSIEFAHLTLPDLTSGNFDFLAPGIGPTQALLSTLRSQGLTWSLNVLVDNYGVDGDGRDTTFLREYFAASGLTVHHVGFEADFVPVAQTLIAALRPRGVRVAPDGVILRTDGEDRHIVTTEIAGARPKSLLLGTGAGSMVFEQRRATSHTEVVLVNRQSAGAVYGCALLTSCWVLARFGVRPYCDVVRLDSSPGAPAFVGGRIITVLPNKFLRVEGTVMELLGHLRDRNLAKLRDDVMYIFHSANGHR